MSHIFFQLCHLALLSYNGKGFFLFDIISVVQSIASQLALAVLLIMLAWGWTITRSKIDSQDIELAIPVAAFVLFLHAMIGALIFLDNEESHKYHDYQGVQGILLCLFRLCLYAAFILGIVQTKKDMKDKGKVNFMIMLAIAGTFYFLALPFSVIICGMINPFK